MRGPGLRGAAASSVLSLLRLPVREQGSGALQTRTLTHAHTRQSSCQSKPCNPRARTTGERGRRQKEKKEKGRGRVTGSSSSCRSGGNMQSGESQKRQRRRLPGPAPASASPLLGTGASGAGQAGDRASQRPGDAREPVGARARGGRAACAPRAQPGPEPRPE